MIILAGMIGSGKTTYTLKLSEELGTEPFFEPVDENPILDKYYEDPDRYGFALQIYFLNKRFALIKEAYANDNNVLDRSIYEDALFTKVNVEDGNITETEFAIYLDLLDNMMSELDSLQKSSPDLMVYLDGSFDHIMDNIKKRGRDFEQPTAENGLLDYYRHLYDSYGDWYANYDKGPKMSIYTDHFDIHKAEDWETVFAQIKKAIERR
ncbi:deoxynucleoside kinase [Aerococcus kribbianus]|uniref:Deoxynucleoside kinase n=1 Tax=Aerococcus kribbianus TaxID=2999064 RepID=A0A9X3FM36_9LACT|nr:MULTISPECIES: deoxynucleoside kinase [unclassified Aerococcus]MCZ0716739.1 deoxynucleoside kinase [Aerococcus sp. YH-aer221]MCZ0725027.1 deoxynucleoside kinase [Aerococcus sp. YH-aer222]